MKAGETDYKVGIALAFYREAMDRAERAERELLEAQKNARRYEWMRVNEGLAHKMWREWLRSMKDTEALDAAIDAAISAGPGGKA